MLKKKIKKVMHKVGLDVKKYKPINYKWLENLEIQSVIDVGANVGQFANEINKILPKVKIYAFEPLTDCFNELRNNTKKLNIQLYNYALGNENGKNEINMSNHTPSSSLLKMTQLHKDIYVHSKDHNIQKIEVRKLDDMYGNMDIKFPILLKLDVQGYELEVLRGAKDFLNRVKVVLTEINYSRLYQNQATFKDLFLLLDSYGFAYRGNLVQTVSPINGEVLYTDSVFVK
ncbi:MAG: FkbM family methyltransferase [Ignavibacteriaceae bacterium]